MNSEKRVARSGWGWGGARAIMKGDQPAGSVRGSGSPQGRGYWRYYDVPREFHNTALEMLLFLFSVIKALGVGRTGVVLDMMEEIAMETG